MNQVWVRKALPADVPRLSEWLHNTPNNLFDPAVPFYPLTTVNYAFKQGKGLAFMPLQLAGVLESLAINPANSSRETAIALAELVRAAVLQSRDKGVKELYFVCSDESTAEFAKRHQFEEMTGVRTFRMKIDDLENLSRDELVTDVRSNL